MVECQVLQLAMYQGDCCDTPPEGYCTLCENGSQNYNADKVIPPNAGGPTFEVTCDNFATRNMYLREGATGICSDTERARARAWCEVRFGSFFSQEVETMTVLSHLFLPPSLSL